MVLISPFNITPTKVALLQIQLTSTKQKTIATNKQVITIEGCQKSAMPTNWPPVLTK